MTADHQTALWIAHPILQLAVAAAMYRYKLHRLFPVFFTYICFQIVAFAVLYPMSSQWVGTSYQMFFWSYWLCAAVNLILGFMVIYEIFLDVFRPYHTLKDLGSVLFKWAALVMSLVAFVVAASSPTGDQGPIVQAVITVTRCVRVSQVGLVLFLLVFARYLGVSWKQHSFGLSLGLGLAAGVELGTLAFHVSGHASEVMVHVTNLVAYNIAILIWLGYALVKSEARAPVAELFAPNRWERSLSEVQSPTQGDSLIPMFESMVDRAFSRTQADYSPKKAAPDSAPEPVFSVRSGIHPVSAQRRRVQ
ncbi:MAG: hypothetical protein ACRD20_00410 [Terriglobales bacterium]